MNKKPDWLEKKKNFASGASRVTFWRRCESYLIVHEQVSNKPYGGSGYTTMRSAYSREGLYIGPTRVAWAASGCRKIPATSRRS